MACALDRYGELALMRRAGAGDTARQDLGALGHIAAEPCDILVVDVLDPIYTETAYLTAASVTHRSVSHSGFSFHISMDVNLND